MDVKEIIKKIKAGVLSKVYLLHGEEPYYIDLVCDAIIQNALPEHERDFNQTILYGKDAELLSLLSELKSYPMMAERRVVVLKEAQDFKQLDDLESYFDQPNGSTVFVICYKYKFIDARKKIIKAAQKDGIILKSEKVREYQLSEWIQRYVKGIGYDITSKAAMLLAEFLGNDLSRIVNELEKLSIIIEKGTTINDIHVEENIGISKDYNAFELTNAVAKKDSVKAMKIVQYFEYNPKALEFPNVVSALFKHFSQLMRIHFFPVKTKEALAQQLGLHQFVVGELLISKNLYDPKKIASVVALLHEYDLKSKGVGSANTTSSELLRELVFQIIH